VEAKLLQTAASLRTLFLLVISAEDVNLIVARTKEVFHFGIAP
jgi:hypothetical protein